MCWSVTSEAPQDNWTISAAYSEFCWDASCLNTRHLRHQTHLIFVSFPQYLGWHELVILAAQNWSHTGGYASNTESVALTSYLDHISDCWADNISEFLTIKWENNQRVLWHKRKHAAASFGRWTFQTHHMMRPVMMATQVTQQVSGLLLSSSMSLQQQHRQIRYTVRTSRLRPRPTAPTHARKISDWGRREKRRQRKCS